MVFGKKKHTRGRVAQQARRRRAKGRTCAVTENKITDASETSDFLHTGSNCPQDFTTVCPKCCTNVTISKKILIKHATTVSDGNARAAAHWEQEMMCGACRDDPGRVTRWHECVASNTEYQGSFEKWGREYNDVADLAATDLAAASFECDSLALGRTRSGGTCSPALIEIESAAEQSPRSRSSSPVTRAPPLAMRICHTCGEVFRGAKTLKRLRLHVKGRRNPCYRPNTEHHDCKVPVHLRSATDFEIDVHIRTEVWTTAALCIQAAWRRVRARRSDGPYDNPWSLQERLRSAPAWHPTGDPVWRDGVLLDMSSELLDMSSELLDMSPPADRPGSPVGRALAGYTKPSVSPMIPHTMTDDVFVVLSGRDPSQRLVHPVPLVLDGNDETAPLARGDSDQSSGSGWSSVMWTRESFRDIGLPPSALMGQ